MTVRRKESGELSIVKWGMGTSGFRVVLLVMVMSMHPVGRGILNTFGFKFQDEQKINTAAEEARNAKTELNALSNTATEVRQDVASLKANMAILNSKVDRLDQTVTGFQVDFQRYKKPEIATPTTNKEH